MSLQLLHNSINPVYHSEKTSSGVFIRDLLLSKQKSSTQFPSLGVKQLLVIAYHWLSGEVTAVYRLSFSPCTPSQ